MAGVELTLEGRALLAQLAAGHEAFVSGPTAGALYGLRAMPTTIVEITIMEWHSARLPERCRLVRTSWIDEQRDVVVREDGIRLASPLRMLFGLAGQFNRHRFERAAEDVWHRGLAGPADADAYLQAVRRSGRGGVKRMDAWLEQTALRPRPAQSGLELDLVDLAAAAGLPTPQRQFPLVWRPARRSTSTSPGRRSGSPSSRATRGGTGATSGSDATRPATARAAPSAGSSCGSTSSAARDRVTVIRELQARLPLAFSTRPEVVQRLSQSSEAGRGPTARVAALPSPVKGPHST